MTSQIPDPRWSRSLQPLPKMQRTLPPNLFLRLWRSCCHRKCERQYLVQKSDSLCLSRISAISVDLMLAQLVSEYLPRRSHFLPSKLLWKDRVPYPFLIETWGIWGGLEARDLQCWSRASWQYRRRNSSQWDVVILNCLAAMRSGWDRTLAIVIFDYRTITASSCLKSKVFDHCIYDLRSCLLTWDVTMQTEATVPRNTCLFLGH